MAHSPLYFKQLQVGPMQNFAYLIGDTSSREAAVVDPGWEIPRILEMVAQDGYRLTGAFATHHHFDHVGGLDELLKAVDIPVYVHRADAPSVRLARGTVKSTEEGQVVQVGQLPVTAIHTPGHTPGSQCLLVEGHLLAGDTLFVRACGRWDLPGGSAAELFESLVNKLKRLDEATVVCPGHHYAEEPTSTIGAEKRTNPFMQPATVQEFLRLAGVV